MTTERVREAIVFNAEWIDDNMVVAYMRASAFLRQTGGKVDEEKTEESDSCQRARGHLFAQHLSPASQTSFWMKTRNAVTKILNRQCDAEQ